MGLPTSRVTACVPKDFLVVEPLPRHEPRHEDAELERCYERIAGRLRALRMESLALFVIEAHLPLTTVLYHLVLAASPLGAPLFGAGRVRLLELLFSDRRNLRELARRIERQRDASAGTPAHGS